MGSDEERAQGEKIAMSSKRRDTPSKGHPQGASLLQTELRPIDSWGSVWDGLKGRIMALPKAETVQYSTQPPH